MDSQTAILRLLARYAALHRMNGHCDAEISAVLQELGVSADDAGRIIHVVNDNGVTSESNSKATPLGCCSMIISVGVTLTAAMGLTLLIRPVVGKTLVVLVSVAVGFGIHVAFSRFMEKLGVNMTRVVPVEIPSVEEVRRKLDALRGIR